LEHAKDIALTPDAGRPNKFSEETAYVCDFLEKLEILSTNSQVLDFGCGMGRISKELIERFGCSVIGVDMSERMLAFAETYVASEKFFPKLSYEAPESIDVCIASFVLQHVEHPEQEIKKIRTVVKPGGHVVLLDDGKRFVPSGVDQQGLVVWSDDQISIDTLMRNNFSLLAYFRYPNRDDLPLSLWRKPYVS
jgi:ubiquinone/menaquinone biosynthesis C-methylase UbiE